MRVIVNILMAPNMPQSELDALIRMFSQMGVDGIRLKPLHERQADGTLMVRAGEYRKHLNTIQTLLSDERLRRPDVTVAKIEGLLAQEEVPKNLPKYCWYRDFNPLVLGADGHLYACCEMKYEEPFDKGSLVHDKDNFMDILLRESTAQSIIGKHCFKGCKGYLPNNDLQLLLDRYTTHGDAIFELSDNIAVRERVLANLPRTVLGN